MPSVQIKNVPADVHRVLRRRAADRGQSLQEYLLARLSEDARQESIDEVFERVRKRAGVQLDIDFVVDALRDDRDRR